MSHVLSSWQFCRVAHACCSPPPCRASDDKELTKSWAGELGGSEVFAAYKDHPAELGCLLDSLAGLAASAPGDGSLVAVWLLCRYAAVLLGPCHRMAGAGLRCG